MQETVCFLSAISYTKSTVPSKCETRLVTGEYEEVIATYHNCTSRSSFVIWHNTARRSASLIHGSHVADAKEAACLFNRRCWGRVSLPRHTSMSPPLYSANPVADFMSWKSCRGTPNNTYQCSAAKRRQSQSGRPLSSYLVQRAAEEFGVAAVQPMHASAPSYGGAIQEAQRAPGGTVGDGEEPPETRRRWTQRWSRNPSHGLGVTTSFG